MITLLVINMMAVSRSTDYAARIVLFLATQEEGALVSIAEIATSRLLPVVRRIVSRLAEAGILRTARGGRGGVALSRSASEISLGDVLAAMEGSTCPSPCVEDAGNCPFGNSCPVRGAWAGAAEILDDYLHKIRFSELANDPGHREAHRKARPARRTSVESLSSS